MTIPPPAFLDRSEGQSCRHRFIAWMTQQVFQSWVFAAAASCFDAVVTVLPPRLPNCRRVALQRSSAIGAGAARAMSTDKQITVPFTKDIDTHNREWQCPVDPLCSLVRAGVLHHATLRTRTVLQQY